MATLPELLPGLETRLLPGNVEVRKGASGAPMIVGHAAVFHRLSEDLGGFREKVAPGAFERSLKGDVRALWNHNPSQVLGRTKNKTLRLREDSVGLAVEIDPPQTAAARDLLASIQRGDVDQMSFGFRTRKDRWETVGGKEVRVLLDVDLLDVSPVTFAAYPQTDVAVRSLQAWRQGGAGRSPELGVKESLLLRQELEELEMEQAEAAMRRAQDLAFEGELQRAGAHRGDVREAIQGARLGPTPARQRSAYHEAGHEVFLWDSGAEPGGAVIFGQGGGFAWARDPSSWTVRAILGGAAAARRAGLGFGGPSPGDEEWIHRLLPREQPPEFRDGCYRTFCQAEVERRLVTRWGGVEALAQHLLREGWISGPDTRRLLESSLGLWQGSSLMRPA